MLRQTRNKLGPTARLSAIWCAFLAAAAGWGSGSALAQTLPDPVVIERVETRFDPARDVFAFANGLRWNYDVDGAPPPDAEAGYDQRCFQMARAARQFFHGVRFDPQSPALDADEMRSRLRDVMASDPRTKAPIADPIVIPGYADLASFSAANAHAIKQALGGSWRAYHQRGNWRMVFGFTPAQERRTAESLLTGLERGEIPIIHVMRFPNVTVNHALLVHGATSTTTTIDFEIYDPNRPGQEVDFRWERAEARFVLGRTPYWAGGPVHAYEIYHGFID